MPFHASLPHIYDMDTPTSAITLERTMRDFMRYCFRDRDRMGRANRRTAR
jgi:hypothetical protein